MKKMNELVYGNRLVLERFPYSKNNANLFADMINKNQEHLIPWLDWIPENGLSGTAARDFLRKSDADWNAGTRFLYSIRSNAEFVGSIVVSDVDYKVGGVEIWYWLDSGVTGRGFAGEALSTLERAVFLKLPIDKIQIFCDMDNVPAIGVAMRAGYKERDIVMNARRCPVRKRYVHDLLFLKQKSDWQKSIK